MKNFNLRFFLISIFLAFCLNRKLATAKNAECVLYNERYKNEYLYSGILFGLARRYVFSWSPIILNSLKDQKEYIFKDDDKKAVWVFESVGGEQNTYYIKSLEYKEYFYATGFHNSFFNARRRVFTWMTNSDLDDSYKWRLNKLDTDKYELWNVKYNEPLYAASHFFRHDSLRRNVFTWHKKPDSTQFNWIVKCKNNEEL